MERLLKSGSVMATARLAHIGRTTHVWQIDMRNDTGELSCVSRLAMAMAMAIMAQK